MRYEVIVVGGGHAGCEAALAAARMGHGTLLVTLRRKGIPYSDARETVEDYTHWRVVDNDVSLLRAPGEKPIGVERIWWGNGPLPEGLATGARTDPFRQLGITDPDELPDLGTAIDEAVTAAGF